MKKEIKVSIGKIAGEEMPIKDGVTMPRTIKFRVWENFINEMHYPKERNHDLTLCMNGGVHDEGGEFRRHIMVPMLSTGLTDKNGKEIWEGDLVRKQNLPPKVIEFKCGEGVEGEIIMGFTMPSGNDDMEVLGNIYQNKDLLK